MEYETWYEINDFLLYGAKQMIYLETFKSSMRLPRSYSIKSASVSYCNDRNFRTVNQYYSQTYCGIFESVA